MKIKVYYLIIVILFICLSPPSLFSQETGDVNNDGSINIIDALLVAQYSVGLNPENFFPGLADMNCDSNINIVDASLLHSIPWNSFLSFWNVMESPLLHPHLLPALPDPQIPRIKSSFI